MVVKKVTEREAPLPNSSRTEDAVQSDVDVVLKQVNPEDLDGLGRLAMTCAFPGFADQVLTPEMADQRRVEMMKTFSECKDVKFDVMDEHYRRFAGDESLTRGRYYSLGLDESGDDVGTLVHELMTYHRPRDAGVVQVYDTTLASDRAAIERAGIRAGKGPALVLHFIRTPARPSPFPRLAGLSGDSAVVVLPLRVERRRLDGVVDLRNPSTASLVTRHLSEITWHMDGEESTRAFPVLRPLESCAALIPSLLEQNIGGTDLTNVIGLWLRYQRIPGLIYPSARVDARVEVRENRMISSAGFNYVHYAGAALPGCVMFHVASRLPKRVRFMHIGASEEDPPYELPHVSVHFQTEGRETGSWNVEGLRSYQEISSGLSSIEYLLEEHSARAAEIAKTLYPWLVSRLPRETGELLAWTIFYALLGFQRCRLLLSRTIRDLLQQTSGEDEIQLIGALMDIERACASAA